MGAGSLLSWFVRLLDMQEATLALNHHREGQGIERSEINNGVGAAEVRIVGRAVMLSKADGYQERQQEKGVVQ